MPWARVLWFPNRVHRTCVKTKTCAHLSYISGENPEEQRKSHTLTCAPIPVSTAYETAQPLSRDHLKIKTASEQAKQSKQQAQAPPQQLHQLALRESSCLSPCSLFGRTSTDQGFGPLLTLVCLVVLSLDLTVWETVTARARRPGPWPLLSVPSQAHTLSVSVIG